MKSTEIDWQDGQDGRVSVITLLLNNYLNIFLHPFLFRTTKIIDPEFELTEPEYTAIKIE